MVVAFARSLAAAALVACICVSFAAEDPSSAKRPASGQLMLRSGDSFAGRLVDSAEPGAISWQSKIATKPFVFPLEKLKSASLGVSDKAVAPQGDFCFELHGGQAIFGELAEVSDRSFVIDAPRFGRVELERDALARFFRAKGARSGLADGLQGLSGWTIEGVETDWSEEAGDLVTEVRGASLTQDVEVPQRYYVEIDAEWSRDFGVKFEVGDDFQIESWEEFVILARQPSQRPLVAAADTAPTNWRYTFDQPPTDWYKADFDDSKWPVGRSGFGAQFEPYVGVIWETPDIWVRRTFDMPKASARPNLYIRHDEDADVYINGVHAASIPNFNGAYEAVRMSDEAVAALKPRGNVMAIHCIQTSGGQYIDAGLVVGGGADGDFASIQQSPEESGGGLRVRCFVDRIEGTVTVTDFDGKTLSTVKLPPNAAPEDATETLPLRISSYCNHLRLKQLVLNEWVGQSTKLDAGGRLLVRRNDGTALNADAISMLEGGQQLDVQTNGGHESVSIDDVASVTFAPRNYGSTEPYWANLRDGTVLSGSVKGIQNGALAMRSTISSDEISIPVGDLLSLSNIAVAASAAAPDAQAAANGESATAESEIPRLDAEGVSSYGELVESSASDDALGLSWKPIHSTTAAPLRRDARLRIVLRTMQQETRAGAEDETPLAALYRAQGLIPPVESLNPEAEKRRALEAAPGLDAATQYLVLINGDRVSCQVTRFDESGVYVASDSFAETFIPAAQIRIWETNRDSWLDGMRDAKRRRMMTLPRKQRDAPPTHLIESVTGDFMRTKLIRGDEDAVYAAVQREERPIDRSKIQRIVWLPDTEISKQRRNRHLKDKETTEASTDAKPSANAQVVGAGDFQLTFHLDKLENGRLIGDSAELGPCNVALDDVSELRVGDAELGGADKLVDSKWRLRDAIDPIYMQDQVLEEQGILTAGLNHTLVGKPAPEITAMTLVGEAMRLEEMKGQVIVLDFWATWCGPCIQSMPDMVTLINEYDDSKVRMVAVNIGEGKETITDCLTRLNISPNVAMDESQRISEKYLVKSIPQTVLIGADGNVARVFVGTTPGFHKQLKFAIDELLKP